MTAAAIIVILGILGVLLVLAFDLMRPGFTLFSCAVVFMAAGVITPTELLSGFSNREMMTVAMLFLVGEGIRQSGSLRYLIRSILPRRKSSVGWMLMRILPMITTISMVLNNTAVVIVFAPIIKRWADRIGSPATKYLIPLSYATILGGLCTLIGTSTNMVVNGLMQGAGYRGLTMFELGKVGGVIALVGLIYIFIFGNKLLPDGQRNSDGEKEPENTVEVLLAARFPGVGQSVRRFNFYRHYGAKILSIRRRGRAIESPLEEHIFEAGDMVRLSTDDAFVRMFRESSAFYIVSSNEDDDEGHVSRRTNKRRWAGLVLLIVMVLGATFGDWISNFTGGVRIDMFFMAAIAMVLMALFKLFPAKRYTKFITWDVLIAIASAFALSKAMSNSGISDMTASWILSLSQNWGGYGVLALLYLVTMLLTELITNSAAVAIAFPVAVALSNQMGIDPMPLFVAICIAASASFSSPIGYQTNLIVQGVGGYKFIDYLRIGIWLNLITFLISFFLIPLIWKF